MKRKNTVNPVAIVILALLLAFCIIWAVVELVILKTETVQSFSWSRYFILIFGVILSLIRLCTSTGGRKRLSTKEYLKAYGEHIGRAFESEPKTREQLLRAVRRFDEDNLKGALKQLHRLLPLCKNIYDRRAVLLFLALTYTDAGLLPQAIEAYERLLDEDFENDTAMRNVALLYTQRGDFEQAKSYYEKAIRIAPEEALGYHNLASLHYRMAEYDRALELSLQAIAHKANLYQSASLLAILYALRGEREQSSHYFDIAVNNGGNAAHLRATIEEKLNELQLGNEEQ